MPMFSCSASAARARLSAFRAASRRAEPLLLADGGGGRGFPAARLESDRREAEAGHARAAGNAGGGGFGDPVTRDAASLARDLAEGYVTPEGAARDYGKVQ